MPDKSMSTTAKSPFEVELAPEGCSYYRKSSQCSIYARLLRSFMRQRRSYEEKANATTTTSAVNKAAYKAMATDAKLAANSFIGALAMSCDKRGAIDKRTNFDICSCGRYLICTLANCLQTRFATCKHCDQTHYFALQKRRSSFVLGRSVLRRSAGRLYRCCRWYRRLLVTSNDERMAHQAIGSQIHECCLSDKPPLALKLDGVYSVFVQTSDHSEFGIPADSELAKDPRNWVCAGRIFVHKGASVERLRAMRMAFGYVTTHNSHLVGFAEIAADCLRQLEKDLATLRSHGEQAELKALQHDFKKTLACCMQWPSAQRGWTCLRCGCAQASRNQTKIRSKIIQTLFFKVALTTTSSCVCIYLLLACFKATIIFCI